MNARSFVYRFPSLVRSLVLSTIGWGAFFLVSLIGLSVPATAQVDLLPLDHPATKVLQRLFDYGALPDFPSEHLPLSRRSALQFLERGAADSSIPENLRRQAAWYRTELAADAGLISRSVVIPMRDTSILIFDDPFANRPFTGLDYFDSATQSSITIDPILDGEFRYDADLSAGAGIMQGGARIRGTVMGHLGFSGRATNGTILGDEKVVLADPRFGHAFKFGVVKQNRDIDFGGGHMRADFDAVALEIGRESVRLGEGGDQSLLLGAVLPSDYDYLRFQMRLGPFAFSHVHAALLADPEGDAVGISADIPEKFLAAHLLTVGPFAGVRLSLGEAVIYSGRSFQIGYLNPLNFMKSQEHFLRDRDNSYMYAGVSVNPIKGVMVEGEFMLDDLVFSRIGDYYWGNKTAWRLGGVLTALPLEFADIRLSYTHLEPYVYSHFKTTNGYLHDGAMLAASGLEPNSYLLNIGLDLYPAANLSVRLNAGIGEHGANVVEDGKVVRNVGGDVRRTFDSLSSDHVEFLDGTLQSIQNFSASVEYEVLHNVYLRMQGIRHSRTTDDADIEKVTQVWFGVRVGGK